MKTMHRLFALTASLLAAVPSANAQNPESKVPDIKPATQKLSKTQTVQNSSLTPGDVQAGGRIWTDTKGRKITGELVSVTMKDVQLRVGTKKISVPLTTLSEDDNKFVASERVRLHMEAEQQLADATASLKLLQEKAAQLGEKTRSNTGVTTTLGIHVDLPTGETIFINSINKARVLRDAENKRYMASQRLKANP